MKILSSKHFNTFKDILTQERTPNLKVRTYLGGFVFLSKY